MNKNNIWYKIFLLVFVSVMMFDTKLVIANETNAVSVSNNQQYIEAMDKKVVISENDILKNRNTNILKDPYQSDIDSTQINQYATDPSIKGVENDEELDMSDNKSENSLVYAAKKIKESTNLKDFLVNVDIDAEVDETGNYKMYPYAEYKVTLSFSENKLVQFVNDAELKYEIPIGINIGEFKETTFPIEIRDNAGRVEVKDNTFKVANNELIVKFNHDDPNFNRLTKVANIEFNVEIKGCFSENVEKIQFNNTIEKKINIDKKSDFTIVKKGSYDREKGIVNYVVVVKSIGVNKNVEIKDQIRGTALVFNNDVKMESNKVNPVNHNTEKLGNGFKSIISELSNEETLIIKYSATVDHNKINNNGTAQETNNSIVITSDTSPNPKADENDLKGKINIGKIQKIKTSLKNVGGWTI